MDSVPDMAYALGIALLCLHVTHFLIREINECRRNRDPGTTAVATPPSAVVTTEPFASTADEVDILNGGPGGADVPDVAA